jgi:hypothetical protein
MKKLMVVKEEERIPLEEVLNHRWIRQHNK